MKKSWSSELASMHCSWVILYGLFIFFDLLNLLLSVLVYFQLAYIFQINNIIDSVDNPKKSVINLLQNLMGLNKNQIELLQKQLSPSGKKFNILEVIEKFPDNQHMHETFRQICLHYESSSLSFNQIIQYLFGQFNKVHSDSNINNSDTKCLPLRIMKNTNQQEEFRVVLIGAKTGTQKIKELVISQELEHTNKSKQQMYAITYTSVWEYDLTRQHFYKQPIKVADNLNVIIKSAVVGNLIGYITKSHDFYVQVLPSKLAEVTKKRTHSKDIQQQINKVNLLKLLEDQILSLFAFSEEQWVIVYQNKIQKLSFKLTSDSYIISPSSTILLTKDDQKISKSEQLKNQFLAILTNSKQIAIVNTTKMKFVSLIKNDIPLLAICFNKDLSILIASDFAGFIMSLTFNDVYGDFEEQAHCGRGDKPEFSQLKFEDNELYSTKFLKESKVKKNTAMADDDQVYSKQMKTRFTAVAQNSERNPIIMISSKEKTVFTYQSKYRNFIKLWDIKTLQVYQKIYLKMQINEMKVCRNGLYIVSREKGYLCYYPIERQDFHVNKKTQAQILDLCINSNVLYINTVNLNESNVYRLRLSNNPTLTSYSKNSSQNPQKSFKYAFYKNEVILFNLTKAHSPQLEITGIFGENKQTIKSLKDYYELTRYPEKDGIVLWGHKKIHIRAKFKEKKVIHQFSEKGQKVFTNFSLHDEGRKNSDLKDASYTQLIYLPDQISKVKCFENHLTIISICSKGRSNSYILDENTMCLSYIFHQIDEKYRILQCHRSCSLIMEKEGSQKKNYFLFEHKSRSKVWVNQKIEGWNFQSVNFIYVSQHQVQIMCVYRSATFHIDRNYDKPIFYFIKTKIEISTEQKNLVSVPKSYTNKESQLQTTLEEIIYRSIYQKIQNSEIESSKLINKEISKANYKLFLPRQQLQTISLGSIDFKSFEGKLLYSDKGQSMFMFAVIVQSMLFLYQMQEQIVAEVIGIFNFNNNKVENSILHWNNLYKRDQEQLWQETKNRAINKVKNRNSLSFAFNRSDSLRETNRIFNPQLYEDTNFKLEQRQKRNKSSLNNMKKNKSDAQQINQVLHRHNIQKGIVQSILINALGNAKRSKPSSHKKQEAKKAIDGTDIKTLTSTIRMTTQTFMKQTQRLTSRGSTFDLKRRLKTDNSTENNTRKEEWKKKARYGTEGIEQLQKSRIIMESFLPKLGSSRNQSVRIQNEKKANIYNLLKMQNLSIKQTKNLTNRKKNNQ